MAVKSVSLLAMSERDNCEATEWKTKPGNAAVMSLRSRKGQRSAPGLHHRHSYAAGWRESWIAHMAIEAGPLRACLSTGSVMLLMMFGECDTNVRHSCGSSLPSSFRWTMLFATSNVCRFFQDTLRSIRSQPGAVQAGWHRARDLCKEHAPVQQSSREQTPEASRQGSP